MKTICVYEDITNKIVESLHKGVRPWKQPWGGCQMSLPVNVDTRKPYQGINILLLWLANQDSPYWGTQKTWQRLGGTVQDANPTQIYFWMFFNGRNGRVPFLRSYEVYNLTQIRGCDDLRRNPDHVVDFTPAENVITKNEVRVREAKKAYYDIGNDTVFCPPRRFFESVAGYYTTKLHEVAHWTGHASRLNRVFGRDKASPEYAYEELVAELTSCFLASALLIPEALEEMPNHVSYVRDWLRILNDDPRAIFRAASLAQKATTYLLSRKK